MSPDPKSKKSMAAAGQKPAAAAAPAPQRGSVPAIMQYQVVEGRPAASTTELLPVHHDVIATLGTQRTVEVPLNGLDWKQILRKIKAPLVRTGQVNGYRLCCRPSVDVVRFWIEEKRPKAEPKPKKQPKTSDPAPSGDQSDAAVSIAS